MVRDLPPGCTDAMLKAYFEQFGPTIDIYIPKDHAGNDRGFAYIKFQEPSHVDTILNGQTLSIAGQVLDVVRASNRNKDAGAAAPQQMGLMGNPMMGFGGAYNVQSSRPQDKGNRIFVGGVNEPISEEDVKNHFGMFGNVEDVYFPNRGGVRSGFCFVRFSDSAAANAALGSVREINGQGIG